MHPEIASFSNNKSSNSDFERSALEKVPAQGEKRIAAQVETWFEQNKEQFNWNESARDTNLVWQKNTAFYDQCALLAINKKILKAVAQIPLAVSSIISAYVLESTLLLRFVSDDLRNDPAVVFAAVKYDEQHLHYVSEALRNDPAVVFAAVEYNP
jgi:hypothetical protein